MYNSTKTVFGFLPISNLKQFRISEALKPNKILTETEFDPVTIHEVIKSTGKPNFEKARIQLPSKINFELLDEICKNYWDYQVPLFLRYGFPLDFPVEHEDELQTTIMIRLIGMVNMLNIISKWKKNMGLFLGLMTNHRMALQVKSHHL